jgi:hypothetical protein
MRVRRLGVALITIAALLVGASPTHAQYPPQQQPRLEVEPRIGFPNYPFVATVFNCLPNEPVTFNLLTVSIPTVCSPTTLQASTPMTAPAAVGTYQVTADLFGVPTAAPLGFRSPALVEQASPIRLVLTDTIEVIDLAPTTTTPLVGGDLATTGSNGLGSTLTSALILLVVGAGFLLVGRARRRTA